MDGVMWVHHPRAAAMKQVLTDGMLGDLRRVTSAFTFRWEQPPTNEYRLDRLLCGGSLLDLGWYNVGVTLWAFEALPQRVSATARWHGGVDHSLDATLWFDDVRRASFDCGFDVPLRKWVEIAGTHGSLVCDDFTRPWTEDRPRFWRHDSGGKVTEQLIPGSKQEVCLIDTFCRLVQAGQLDASWPRRSIEVQQVCDALERSARTGKVTEFMGLKRDAEIVVGP